MKVKSPLMNWKINPAHISKTQRDILKKVVKNTNSAFMLSRYPLIGAKIGDTVYVKRSPNSKRNIGIIQYIGPLDGLDQESVWFGVELLVSNVPLRNFFS
jgi:hypothetical protein